MASASPFLMNAWYCAAWLDELTATPIMRKIGGKPFLMFMAADGVPAILPDRCPHRFAPLHRGRKIGDVIECPYHGLQFDRAGRCILNPHGDNRIAAAAHLTPPAICVRQGALWLWPGDAAHADFTSVPDLDLLTGDAPAPISGHLEMEVDYRLVIDNLLDLSHANYLHPRTLSPVGERESNFTAGSDRVRSSYVMRNVETPASQAFFFKSPRGDYHSSMEWLAPGTLRQQISMVECGMPAADGALTHNVHLITPATSTSTHYFWAHSRNRAAADGEIHRKFREMITHAFLNEDEPMIAACQEYMQGEDLFALKPVYLDTDFAATRARRIIEQLVRAESSQRASV